VVLFESTVKGEKDQLGQLGRDRAKRLTSEVSIPEAPDDDGEGSKVARRSKEAVDENIDEDFGREDSDLELRRRSPKSAFESLRGPRDNVRCEACGVGCREKRARRPDPWPGRQK
jgi:hypothetical protein